MEKDVKTLETVATAVAAASVSTEPQKSSEQKEKKKKKKKKAKEVCFVKQCRKQLLDEKSVVSCEHCITRKYCGAVCQATDWLVAGHRYECMSPLMNVELPPRVPVPETIDSTPEVLLDPYTCERYYPIVVQPTGKYEANELEAVYPSEMTHHGWFLKYESDKKSKSSHPISIPAGARIFQEAPLCSTSVTRELKKGNLARTCEALIVASALTEICCKDYVLWMVWCVYNCFHKECTLCVKVGYKPPTLRQWLKHKNFRLDPPNDVRTLLLKEHPKYSEFASNMWTSKPDLFFTSVKEFDQFAFTVRQYAFRHEGYLSKQCTSLSLYQWLGLFNHSCRPNCAVTFHANGVRVYALREIHASEELTISYGPVLSIASFVPSTHRSAPNHVTDRLPSMSHLTICYCTACDQDYQDMEDATRIVKEENAARPNVQITMMHPISIVEHNMKFSHMIRTVEASKSLGRDKLYLKVSYLTFIKVVRCMMRTGCGANLKEFGFNDYLDFLKRFYHSKTHKMILQLAETEEDGGMMIILMAFECLAGQTHPQFATASAATSAGAAKATDHCVLARNFLGDEQSYGWREMFYSVLESEHPLAEQMFNGKGTS